jgi:hypothetical protein
MIIVRSGGTIVFSSSPSGCSATAGRVGIPMIIVRS